MIERVFAAIVLAACLLLLLRLAIGARRRVRLDTTIYRFRSRARRAALALRHWRTARRDADRAKKLADEVIQRARTRGVTGGKASASKSLRKPPRDKMH